MPEALSSCEQVIVFCRPCVLHDSAGPDLLSDVTTLEKGRFLTNNPRSVATTRNHLTDRLRG
jgi:hypothetical protein